MKKLLARVVPVIGLALCLWLIFRIVDYRAIRESLRAAHLGWILCAAVAALLATVVSAFKFSRMLLHAGESRPWSRCWMAIMHALGLNAFLPGKAGDLAKAVYLREEGRSLSVLVGLVILERLADVALLALFAMTGAIAVGWAAAAWIAAAVLVGAIFGVLILRSVHAAPAFKEKLTLAGHSAREFARKPFATIEILLLAAAQWQMNWLMMIFLLKAVGANVPLLATWTATPLAMLAGVVPVTVSGIGTRDGVLLALLKQYARPPQLLAAGFLYTVFAYWFLGIVGITVGGLARIQRRN